MNVSDFDRGYRFRMVKAYPIISGVPDAYEATHDEIDVGFARCLSNSALRRTHDIYLAERWPEENLRPIMKALNARVHEIS